MKYTVSTSFGVTDGHSGKNDDGSGGKHRHVLENKKNKPQRYDPSQMRDMSNGTTGYGALLHLIKSSVGSGVLAMPNAFKNGGLVFGLVGTVAVGVLCAHCIYLLVLCSQTLARRTRRTALGFAETAAVAFTMGPRRFRSWAPFAKKFVNAALFCTYYFGNCVYVILVSASFKQVFDNHTSPEWHYSIRTWILGLALPLLPLGIIRSLRLLVPFSAIATTFIIVGLGCTLSWVVTGASLFASKEIVATAVPLPDISSRPWIAPITHIPLFFTTVIFAMEGIGTVLPIENSMQYPQHFLRARPCGVLNAAMTLVVFLYSIAGFLGYLRFGDTTEGSITLNLPDDLFAEAVKIMVTMSILFSYGLQFCVPSEIAWTCLEPWLRKRRQNTLDYDNDDKECATIAVIGDSTTTMTTDYSTSSTVAQDVNTPSETELDGSVDGAYYVMRSIMILGTFLIAAIVPNLAPVISLFGAVFFSMLGLFCPAIIHLATFWEHGETDDEYFDHSDFENHTDHDHNNMVINGVVLEGVGYVPQKCEKRKDSDGSTGNGDKGMSWLTAAKDIAIVLMALSALVSGAYTSLMDIIAASISPQQR